MSEIFLTGMSGSLGWCVEHFLRQLGADVTCLTGRLQNLQPKTIRAKKLIHIAAALRYRPDDIYQSNVIGTETLLNAVDHVDQIIFVSSRAVYGDFSPPRIVNEEQPCNPTDLYGWSKRMGERAIQASSIPYIILRSTALYGYVPHHQVPNFVQTIINGVQKHGTLKIIGGNQIVDPLPIWDLARFIGEISIQAPRDNLVLNVAGAIQPLQNIADTISMLLDEKSIPYTISHETLENPKGVLLNTHRVRQLFPDWEPTQPQVVIREIIEHSL